MKSSFDSAAYGGDGWQPRSSLHADEIGSIWVNCGLFNEWAPLKTLIVHQPGEELQASTLDPNKVQMLDKIDLVKAREEHTAMVEQYRTHDVAVLTVDPNREPSPNQMFCADLFAMTPEGALLARPASTVRAGEERMMARCLAENGIPILKTLTGTATFEGADLIWLNRQNALLGMGLRTNPVAADQISQALDEIGTRVIPVDMPYGTMHLMGMLRIVDHDLAIAWPRRTPHRAVIALRDAGYRVNFLPENTESLHQRAFNFVTLGPRKILMVDGNPIARKFYESLDIECYETPVTELSKAAGAIGCLSGIVWRQ